MSQLLLLRGASTLQHVASLLQFQPKALAYILYKKPALTKYSSFEITKRSGGVRKISAPAPDLRLLQQRLSDLLQNCVEEINAAQKRKASHDYGRRMPWPRTGHTGDRGFVASRRKNERRSPRGTPFVSLLGVDWMTARRTNGCRGTCCGVSRGSSP